MKYDIATNKDSQKAMLLVLQGKLRIIKEKEEIFLSSKSKNDTITVHPNFRYIFRDYLAQHGNGDGLFPETSQTAG